MSLALPWFSLCSKLVPMVIAIQFHAPSVLAMIDPLNITFPVHYFLNSLFRFFKPTSKKRMQNICTVGNLEGLLPLKIGRD